MCSVQLKMENKKTIGINSLITLGVVITAMITPGFFETQKYYCEAESSIMECPGELSGGSATRCYLNQERTSWDYCKSGWNKITDDNPIQEPDEEQPEPIEPAKAYRCTVNNCTEI